MEGILYVGSYAWAHKFVTVLLVHTVLFSAENFLILSDLDFLKVMSDYFKTIFDPKANKKDSSIADPTATDTSKQENRKSKLVKQETLSDSKKKKAAPLPKMKVNASIKNFRVALIENVDTKQPQALTLKVLEIILCEYLVHVCLYTCLGYICTCNCLTNPQSVCCLCKTYHYILNQ